MEKYLFRKKEKIVILNFKLFICFGSIAVKLQKTTIFHLSRISFCVLIDNN